MTLKSEIMDALRTEPQRTRDLVKRLGRRTSVYAAIRDLYLGGDILCHVDPRGWTVARRARDHRTVYERIRDYLQARAGWTITARTLHQEVGGSRASVTRALGRLQREGHVQAAQAAQGVRVYVWGTK